MTQIDKRDRSNLFRLRLKEAMRDQQVTQSALARATGVDRSTLSQLLAEQSARLPNAQLVGECASALGVSADWLLGLSNRPESAADLLATSMSVDKAPRALVDERIFGWHQEAEGYKIRHVSAGLPDMLKTRAILEWEHRPHLGKTTDQAIGASEDRLEFMRHSQSDFEIALPAHELTSFATAEGYYTGLSANLRGEQLIQIRELYQQLYPRLRIHLFDARKVYSSPLTVFGPLMVALYVGRYYLAFRDTERVGIFTEHFDALVKEAVVADRDVPEFLDDLIAQIS